MALRQVLRLAPWPVRRRVFETVEARVLPRVAPERRLGVARTFMPLVSTRVRGAGGATLRVRTAAGVLTARADPAAAPAEVRRLNLDRVVKALDEAGVDWFRVPIRAAGRTAVAVRAADRPDALAALRRHVADDRGSLRVVRPGRRRKNPQVVAVCWPVTDPGGSLVLGPDLACEVEFWTERDGRLVSPRRNPVADSIPVTEPVTVAPETAFGSFSARGDTTGYRTRRIFTCVDPDRVDFPIDVVYTWVDGSDPAWQRRKAQALADNPWVGEVSEQAANDSRFASRDELRYSLRALHCFAPWVRRVFLVTDDQTPAWLDRAHPRLTVVSHREIFGDTGRLPTFNSQAIESRLHRIPGLAEHFLYLNDDVILGRPVTPEMFFTPGGLTKFFASAARVDTAPRGPADRPADSAAKNNRRLIQETFGRMLTRKMMHTPHPSRRSVIAEIEERFAEQVTATAGHQFRHPDDISLLSSLQQYYAYLTGKAAPGRIRYLYTDLSEPVTPLRLARLLRSRDVDAFCLNDVDVHSAAVADQEALVAEFLPAYLPFTSPFELQHRNVRPIAAPRQPSPGRDDRPVPPGMALPPVA
ncbi:stealth family protein [Actinoplanes xinjiangensis]|uniref:Stealth-like protein n=1 Tax=Actinoplanes xinjiangensis TaxID=512350 RepID=A0A316FP27_9ACTN|nr:stealth family protein [Actinoplanes xinjiangensis]PWK50339.1 Stealth-like protein [Actinoplanes xinjiangensis]GIF36227.1 exopolysaccharide phosphotransferase [Actinoplanes xinjiangensis]